MLYQLDDVAPKLGRSVFVADSAEVIGDAVLLDNASVWFKAVIRADNDRITIGEQSNIQDGAILHTDPGIPLTIGKGVTVGHQAMLHGCEIGDYSLIGIQSVILNGAKIGKHCIIGASALIPEGAVIPDGSLVVGIPGKVKKSLSEEDKQLLELGAEHYVANAKRYAAGLVEYKP
ncbi:gamma carbonic anhydrase family protein [Halioxenophilus aromaticivorans]|uniref:Gamma carbonic anhydrase family protein n=1 Tax=Halioxenophilus aromaticivorans TaxID=1306992 RepID=A0AAV3U829_9ALTE